MQLVELPPPKNGNQDELPVELDSRGFAGVDVRAGVDGREAGAEERATETEPPLPPPPPPPPFANAEVPMTVSAAAAQSAKIVVFFISVSQF
ncbi:hypothetical protein ATN89_17680 [Comamonas thiooxydans]|nr:hypothetical protein ATN89_17680 [Comamonas thiooxydans]